MNVYYRVCIYPLEQSLQLKLLWIIGDDSLEPSYFLTSAWIVLQTLVRFRDEDLPQSELLLCRSLNAQSFKLKCTTRHASLGRKLRQNFDHSSHTFCPC